MTSDQGLLSLAHQRSPHTVQPLSTLTKGTRNYHMFLFSSISFRSQAESKTTPCGRTVFFSAILIYFEIALLIFNLDHWKVGCLQRSGIPTSTVCYNILSNNILLFLFFSFCIFHNLAPFQSPWLAQRFYHYDSCSHNINKNQVGPGI